MTQRIRTPIDAQAMATVVESQFDFLLSAGYKVTSPEADKAVFSNGDLSITFDIEPGSYIVTSEIQRASTGERYTLYSALADHIPMADQEVTCSGRDIDSFGRCLQRLSELCLRYLYPALTGDEAAFTQMATAAREVARKYTSKYQYGPILERANKAWEEKNWDKAQELYESARPALSPIEESRLTYLLSKKGKSSQ